LTASESEVNVYVMAVEWGRYLVHIIIYLWWVVVVECQFSSVSFNVNGTVPQNVEVFGK